jgi:hypothetical protein
MNRRFSLRVANALGLACLFTLLCQPLNIYAADCRTMAGDYITWAQANRTLGDGSNTVGVKMTAAKIQNTNPDAYPWGFGAVAEGRMGLDANGLTGRLSVVFSVRRSADGRRFDPKQADIQDVTLFTDGRVRIILRTWGSATFFLDDVRCYDDGFITGIMREGNGVSMVTLALRKEKIRSASDGFRDWP